MKKIRELGSLPSDTFAKYQKTGVKDVGVACSVELVGVVGSVAMALCLSVSEVSPSNTCSVSCGNSCTTAMRSCVGSGTQGGGGSGTPRHCGSHGLPGEEEEAIQFTFRQVSGV